VSELANEINDQKAYADDTYKTDQKFEEVAVEGVYHGSIIAASEDLWKQSLHKV
jgi:hypothetical protein